MTSVGTRLALYIRCEKLADLDTLSKSDPYAVVYAVPSGVSGSTSGLVELGRTETVMNNLNPTFTRTVAVDYIFESKQLMRVVVYDFDGSRSDADNDLLGSCEFQLAHIVGSRGHTKTFDLAPRGGKLVVTAVDTTATGSDTIELAFRGTKMKKMDTFGQSDPYFKLTRVLPSSAPTAAAGAAVAAPSAGGVLGKELYVSEVIKSTLDPAWRPLPPLRLCEMMGASEEELTLDFACYDKDMFSDDSMGHFRVSVRQLREAAVSKATFTLKKDHKPANIYGEISVTRAQITHYLKFTEMLSHGWQINLAVAVDFTGSNGDPSRPQSLHYRDPSGAPNQYVRALMSVGEILLEYDSDKQIAAFGFGGKLPDGVTSHCFHLNLQPNPYVAGMPGLLQAYGQSLAAVRLSGPTNFAPIIRSVTKGARDAEASRVFTTLLITTDGEITDLDETISAVVDADDAPLAIIIVGVGSGCDFQNMVALDGDVAPLVSGSGKRSRRDLVQFVPMRDYLMAPPTALAAAVLRELPGQVEAYARLRGVKE